MSSRPDESVGKGSDEVEAKLRSIANYVVAAVWALGAFAGLVGFTEKSVITGVAIILVVVAFLYSPTVLRWPMVVLGPVLVIAFAAMAHFYFHALPNYALIVWSVLGSVGLGLLLFGRMTILRLVVGLAVFLASAAFGFPDPRTSSAISPQACKARVDAMHRRLTNYLAEPSAGVVLRAAKLPTRRQGARATVPQYVLEVAPTGKWFQERLPDDASKAGEELRNRLERLRPKNWNPSEPLTFYLAADASYAVHEIATLLSPLRGARPFLLGRAESGPLGVTPPSALDLAERLDGTRDASELAKTIAQQLGRRAGPCGPLAKRLAALSNLRAEDKPVALVKGLEEGLRECRCSWVDIDALEYLVMRALDAPAFDHVAVPVPLDDSGKVVIPSEPGLTVERWMLRL